MSFLVLYNWSPSIAYIKLNSPLNMPGGNPKGALKPSTESNSYYPYSINLKRDPTLEPGDPNVWGRTNNLTIQLTDVVAPMEFQNIADPTNALRSADLWLWIFPDRVVLSQDANVLSEVNPG